MPASIIDLCDKVVALIKAEWGPSESDSVSRVYEAPVTADDLQSLNGRKVYVFPMRRRIEGAATRSEDNYTWGVGILGVERCDEVGGPSLAWMDERTNWIEQTVEHAVNFSGRNTEDYLTFGDRTLWTQSIETDIYDVDHMAEKKLFWSEVEVVFTELFEVE